MIFFITYAVVDEMEEKVLAVNVEAGDMEAGDMEAGDMEAGDVEPEEVKVDLESKKKKR